MIIESVINLFVNMIKLLFSWINLPDMPQSVMDIIDELFGYLEGAVGFVGIFLDWHMVKILFPVLLIVVNFDHVWKFTMFIVHKLPFSID